MCQRCVSLKHADKQKVEPINLAELRYQFGRELPPAEQERIESFIRAFATRAYKKYAAGAKEHERELTPQVALQELIDEATDLFIYSMVVVSAKQ